MVGVLLMLDEFLLTEDGDSNDPDDARNGGYFEFTFATPQFVDHITLLDIESNNSHVKLFSAGGNLIDEISIPRGDDGEIIDLDISTDDVAVMEIHIQTSGALVDYCTYDSGALVDCPPVTCGVPVLFSDFESNENGGYGVWTDGGNDSNHDDFGSPESIDDHSVRLRDNSSTSNITSEEYDLSSFENLILDFSYYTISIENGEDFFFEISTDGGSSFSIVETWVRGTDFENNTRYFDTVDIEGPFSDEVRFRFRADMSNNNDRVFLDNIDINGCTSSSNSSFISVPKVATLEVFTVEDEEVTLRESDTTIDSEIKVYPNPVNHVLTIEDTGENTYQILTMHGKVVRTGITKGQVDVHDLVNGTYILRSSDGRIVRFIKI